MTTAAAYDNRAILKYRISFTAGPDLEGTIERMSGTTVVGSTYYHGLPEPKGKFAGQYRHDKDPERQTVNLLANAVFERLGCNDDQYLAEILTQVTGGSIALYSDKGPCHSCRAVLKQFLQDYPMITSCVVTYRKTDGRGRPIQALEPAGGDLYGSYGYEDAVEVNGNWCKVLR
ncbi:deaminase domain-containing protein [Streptomyces sp. TRM76323]|uniref:Deaminase domain-containing protein n=1 Tax=Streptomyces tamarix TaxID=3078565 RepID=A0ABU3QDZ4_9ACTN|nr:deaminase domain-containing protein [Streptomyces tamarix]MDT9680973.1 deaminase domain-containing protein [Streptomyces tamarix]